MSKTRLASQAIDYEKILYAFHDDTVVVDKNGVVVRVSPSFEEIYGVKAEEALGRTVFYLEKKKIFNPSVAKMVFESGQKATVIQKNKAGRAMLIVAVPIKNSEDEIINVASYSIDVTDLQILEKEYDKLKREVLIYSEELSQYRAEIFKVADMTGNLPGVKEINETINKIAKYDTHILITGESGVGKTTFARQIHIKSNRTGQPFIEISCGAIPENLLESELFGYEKGAFTGANNEGKIGLIEMADKGTLFLDEISELPLKLQVKLLKTLQDKTIMRVGGKAEVNVDFRLIAATNKKLSEQVEQGKFREDLYYRLNVIPLDIMPLRSRPEDTLQLILYFLEQFNQKYSKNKRLNSDAFNHFLSYEWPGNIRQLENVVERIVITTDDNTITLCDLPEECRGNASKESGETGEKSYDELMEDFERKILLDAVAKYKTTVKVAEMLGMSQSSAARKIKQHTSKAELPKNG